MILSTIFLSRADLRKENLEKIFRHIVRKYSILFTKPPTPLFFINNYSVFSFFIFSNVLY